ncbi:MAG: caspase family protein [Chitinispirillales bacterium]|nr:caspase family protein [Chitinispirillales bacterium]
MKNITKTMAVAVIILLTASLVTASIPTPTPVSYPRQIHRFLLVVGANNGGHGRSILRFAVTDAQSFASVLTEMGGVEERNKVFLSEPSVADMHGGFAAIEQKLNNPRYRNGRREIIVYYSGHADEQGLLLGQEVMRWSDLRNQVANLSADLKVAVVDACGSGAITRIKGGAFRPAFLSDASSDMTGYAFLTSSSADEVSQESDRLAGSFFTHALVSGLRGAADMTGSGTVTLSEAYQFAFNETLHSTQSTMGGAQHPSRDMNLTGTGDVVMTDLRHANSGLALDIELEGRFFIRDERGFLVAELYKAKGRAIELGLPTGIYSIYIEAGWVAEGIRLEEGRKFLLTRDMLRSVRREQTITRGGDDGSDGYDGDSTSTDYQPPVPDDVAAIVDDGDDGYDSDSTSTDYQQSVPNDVAAVVDDDQKIDALDTQDVVEIAERSLLDSACAAPHRFNGNFFATSNRPDNGIQLSLLGNLAREEFCGTQIAIGLNIASKDMRGVQISAGMNVATGHLYGTQLANINIAQRLSGVQAGTLNILTDSLDGVQGGAMNIAQDVSYAQGGTMNIARDVGYVQGGVMNIARDVGYAQGGVMNIARDVGYAQGGVMNIARNVGHVQGGVMNIAKNIGTFQGGVMNITGKTTARQVGVVNIAAHSEKTPIGLLNIIGNGIIDLTFYGDIAEGMPRVSFRTGTPWFYTVIEYGHPVGDFIDDFINLNRWPKMQGVGLGTRFGMNGLFHANVDFVWSQFYDGDWRSGNSSYGQKLRVGGSYNPLPFLAATGGVSINGRIEGDDRCPWPINKDRFGSIQTRWTEKGHRLHVWPGLYAGVTVGKVRASQ